MKTDKIIEIINTVLESETGWPNGVESAPQASCFLAYERMHQRSTGLDDLTYEEGLEVLRAFEPYVKEPTWKFTRDIPVIEGNEIYVFDDGSAIHYTGGGDTVYAIASDLAAEFVEGSIDMEENLRDHEVEFCNQQGMEVPKFPEEGEDE